MKKISVICIDCEPSYIDEMLQRQSYEHLEVVEAKTGKGFYEDIAEYCMQTDSDYVCFLELGQLLDGNKIKEMAGYAGRFPTASVICCGRIYIESDGTTVAHQDFAYMNSFKDTLFDGNMLLRGCLERGHNLIGNLTTTMFCREKVKLRLENLRQYETDGDSAMQKAMLLFELLSDQIVARMENALVATLVEDFNLEKFRRQQASFEHNIGVFVKIHSWEPFEETPKGVAEEHLQLLRQREAKDKSLKKEMTFFAMNKGEYYNLLPVMEEAKERGYQVHYTENLDETAEIGVYCQHFGKPQNSQFSVVLLHDMAQGHNRWPNIWEAERWNVYDIGIVPGMAWRELWQRSAFQYYCNPRCGAYMLGYPKSTQIFSEEIKKRAEELRAEMGLKYETSVLYAPSWEYGDKEDDFVRALATLPVNLLIKQAPWSRALGDAIVNNVKDMRKMHEGKYDNLHYFEWDETILVPLLMCDLVVSDESSVMVEAFMFGKPSIAVMDWLIPDTDPVRFSSVPFDNVYKCKRVELREQVEKLLAVGPANADKIKDIEGFFVNKEHVNRDIVDAIEYFTTGKGSGEFKKWEMTSRYMPANLWS
ncbi:MAG: hypothetical protein HFH36_01170 [Lachnospiraceae bacterium]|nr:hypothetical protein [Lachnospiraceae bacterium]